MPRRPLGGSQWWCAQWAARSACPPGEPEGKGLSILRRGYSFTDGIDKRTGQLDAGLFFLAYQADPREQFVPLQAALASGDALNEYIQHVGSALFAIPPGVADRHGFVGETLLG